MATPARGSASSSTAGNPYELLVPQRALDNLKLYKYGAVDKSPITKYFMKPYWDWAVTLFPMWIAPNLITLIGFGFVVFNLACVAYFAPDLEGPLPAWVAYSFPIGLHLYQTFDNVDGRQARRTGSSSPLGELFDHGCDALNCMVGSIVLAASLGVGVGWRAAMLGFIAMFPFFVSTWEEYHTGVLYLGFINGPTEGLLMAQVFMLVSAVYGSHIWSIKASYVLMAVDIARPAFIPKWFTVADIFIVFVALTTVLYQFPASAYNVWSHCRKTGQSFVRAFLQYAPLVVFFGAAYLWLAAPRSAVLSNHFFLFFVAAGLCFGRLVMKIIYAYVTKTAFPLGTVLLLPLVFGAVNANASAWFGVHGAMFARVRHRGPWLPLAYEGQFVQAFAVVAAVQYLVWAAAIILAFTHELKIHAFAIPRKPAVKAA